LPSSGAISHTKQWEITQYRGSLSNTLLPKYAVETVAVDYKPMAL